MDQAADVARQAELDRLAVLGAPPAADLVALVSLAAQVCGVPNATLNLITATEQHQVAAVGFEPDVCGRADSMCAAVLEEPEPVVVCDAREDERFRGNPFVTGELGTVRYYASAPLVTRSGSTIGRLCVFDEHPRDPGSTPRDSLAVVAGRVVDVLELHLRSRQLEESLTALAEARDELQRSNEHLAAFAGQVSHDLRTPLTAVLASAELLAGEPAVAGEPDLVELTEGILRGGGRMAAMLERVLAHAQVGARLTLSDVDLSALLDEVRDDVATLLRDSGAELRVGELPVVRADRHQLHAVVLNLVTNAVKFARPGVPPRIEVTASPGVRAWRVEVTDNGRGIPESERERIFDPFVRLEGAVDGHGIGLATARRVLTAHGGRIGVADAPGTGAAEGTTVWFELPVPVEAGDERGSGGAGQARSDSTRSTRSRSENGLGR